MKVEQIQPRVFTTRAAARTVIYNDIEAYHNRGRRSPWVDELLHDVA